MTCILVRLVTLICTHNLGHPPMFIIFQTLRGNYCAIRTYRSLNTFSPHCTGQTCNIFNDQIKNSLPVMVVVPVLCTCILCRLHWRTPLSFRVLPCLIYRYCNTCRLIWWMQRSSCQSNVILHVEPHTRSARTKDVCSLVD